VSNLSSDGENITCYRKSLTPDRITVSEFWPMKGKCRRFCPFRNENGAKHPKYYNYFCIGNLLRRKWWY